MSTKRAKRDAMFRRRAARLRRSPRRPVVRKGELS